MISRQGADVLGLGATLEVQPWAKLGIEQDGYALVTLHRPALVDDPRLLERTVDAIVDLARLLPLVSESRATRQIPLWDGRAGRRSAEVILRFLSSTADEAAAGTQS